MNKHLEYAKQIAYSSVETLQFTYDMAVKYRHSKGVYVECGCAAGAQIIAMASGAPDKEIFAFDSFQGIPNPSNKDDQFPGIRYLLPDEQKNLPNPGEQKLESSGATVVPLDHFWDHIEKSGVNKSNIVTVPGWFEETVSGFKQRIAILRLDGDLYNSTYVCLEHLYPLLISGGILIVDDWGLPGCKTAILDYFDDLVRPKIEFVSNIAYFIKP